MYIGAFQRILFIILLKLLNKLQNIWGFKNFQSIILIHICRWMFYLVCTYIFIVWWPINMIQCLRVFFINTRTLYFFLHIYRYVPTYNKLIYFNWLHVHYTDGAMPTTTTVDAETTVVTTETTQTAFGKEFNAPVTPRHLTLTNKKITILWLSLIQLGQV